MPEPWVRVIADDLTGACDVGAAFLPHPKCVVVESIDRQSAGQDGDDGVLTVWNTQSRTLAPEAAAARVRRALADVPSSSQGFLFKKIDTALRGPLGAELDAAMDAIRADTALVLPAIPEAGRVTRGGRQLIDGVPIDETAFARDPQNPVHDASVAAVIERTSHRRVASVSLDEMRRWGASGALCRCRADGATVIVGDAESDLDLLEWVAGVVEGPPPSVPLPLVLVGSTSLARAWRSTVSRIVRGRFAGAIPSTTLAAADGGVLVIAGSAHPATRAQLDYAIDRRVVHAVVVDVDDPIASGAEAARRLRSGSHVCLVVPSGAIDGGSRRVLAAMREAATAALERARPGAMLLIGGETAFHVLAGLGHPRLEIEAAPAPLAVRATILDGTLAGMPIVTKGGSSGPPERLAELIGERQA